MSKGKKMSLTANEQLWKGIKIFQVQNSIRSLGDLDVILSLKLIKRDVRIPESCDVDKELQDFINRQNEGVVTR